VPRFDDQIRDTLDQWIFFLKNSEIPGEFAAKGLDAARQKLDRMQLDSEERKKYDDYLEDMRYQASMVQSHFKRGEKSGKTDQLRTTARKMTAKGFTTSEIADLQDVSESEIRALLEDDAS